MALTLSPNHTETLEQVRRCCQAIHDKKGEAIQVLFLGGKSSIADFFVIASGTSDPHLKALSGAVEKTLKDESVPIFGRDRSPGTGWMVVDAYDFIVHLFTPQQRAHFNLEGLWKDAEEVPLDLR